jgi:hypothetical protein
MSYPEQRKTIMELWDRISQLQLHPRISSKILKEIGSVTTTKTTTKEQSKSAIQGMAEQEKIGWVQIRYGRISKSLTRNLSGGNPTGDQINSTTARKLIKLIWDTFLKLWKQRNQHIYGQNLERKDVQMNQRLGMKVERCYNQEHILPINDKTKVFQGMIEDVLAKDQWQVMY